MNKPTNKTLRLTSCNGTVKYFMDVPSIIFRQADGNKSQVYIDFDWIEVDQSMEEIERRYNSGQAYNDYIEHDDDDGPYY